MAWAEDPETGERALKCVVRTFLNEKDELVHVQVKGETITCTTEHPFYVKNVGWVAAKDLLPGCTLVLQNGQSALVRKVTYEKLDTPIKVYNFVVEDFHTYFVGELCVLVHNDCVTGTTRPDKAGHTSNEIYKQLNNKNEVVSMAVYDDAARCVRRIDYLGRSHSGVLPHIHVFGYNERGQRDFEAVYDMMGRKID